MRAAVSSFRILPSLRKKPRPTSYRGARANCVVMGGVMRPTRSTDPSIELLLGVGVE